MNFAKPNELGKLLAGAGAHSCAENMTAQLLPIYSYRQRQMVDAIIITNRDGSVNRVPTRTQIEEGGFSCRLWCPACGKTTREHSHLTLALDEWVRIKEEAGET